MTEPDVPFPSWQAWNRIRSGPGWPGFDHERPIYEQQKAFAAANIKHTSCGECKERFCDDNCYSEAGWQETQISGLCERCFDALTKDDEDEDLSDASGDFPDGYDAPGEYQSDEPF
jgi:hypothetical protein